MNERRINIRMATVSELEIYQIDCIDKEILRQLTEKMVSRLVVIEAASYEKQVRDFISN